MQHITFGSCPEMAQELEQPWLAEDWSGTVLAEDLSGTSPHINYSDFVGETFCLVRVLYDPRPKNAYPDWTGKVMVVNVNDPFFYWLADEACQQAFA
jgi:hypothetical protein